MLRSIITADRTPAKPPAPYLVRAHDSRRGWPVSSPNPPLLTSLLLSVLRTSYILPTRYSLHMVSLPPYAQYTVHSTTVLRTCHMRDEAHELRGLHVPWPHIQVLPLRTFSILPLLPSPRRSVTTPKKKLFPMVELPEEKDPCLAPPDASLLGPCHSSVAVRVSTVPSAILLPPLPFLP